MSDHGSEYSADEITAMLGHFAREEQLNVAVESSGTATSGVGPFPISSDAPLPSRPQVPRPADRHRPDTSSSRDPNGQADVLDQMQVHLSSPSQSTVRPTMVSPKKNAISTGGAGSPAVPPGRPDNPVESESAAPQKGRHELLALIAEAQSVYRRQIKNRALDEDDFTGGQATGDDSDKIVPPSRFEIRWEKNLRQAKGDSSRLTEVIQRLGATRDSEMTKLLKRFVSAKKKRVRFAVARALRGMATPEAKLQLLSLLRDRKNKVARAALISLAMHADATTLPPILAYARIGSEERAVVAREIRKLESETVRADLLALARDSCSEVTAIAIYVAGQVSDRASVNDFSPFLSHSSWQVRLATIDALLQTDNQQVARFLTEALSDSAPEVRARAAAGLGRWPTKNSPCRLLKLLKDESAPVRRAAAGALKDIATDDLGAEIGRFLSKETDVAALVSLIECVGRVGAEGNSEALFALSRHAEEGVRIAALSALTRQGDQRIASALGGLLADNDPLVRAKAVTGLGQPKNLKAIQQLEGILRNDREIGVRAAAAKSLGRIGSKTAIPALEQAMYDEAVVRCQAVVGLRTIGSQEAIPILLERLGDSAPEVRYNAVSALGALQSKESVPELVRLIEDPNDMVRRSAHKALDKLGYDVSAELRNRKARRLVAAVKERIPGPRMAATIVGSLAALVLAGMFIVAPDALGLGPTLFIGKASHIDISPDGSKVSILRSGGISEVWSVSDGQLLVRKVTPFSALAGLFTSDSKNLRLFSDKQILSWSISADEEPSESHRHGHMLHVRAISPDRKHMLTTSTTNVTPEYWDPNGNPKKVEIPAPFLRTVAMSSDGTLIAGVNKRNELLVLRQPGEVLGKLQLSFPGERRPRVSSMAFSDKSVLAIGTKHGEHRIIDLVAGTEHSLTGGEPINRLLWIDDHLWSIEDGQIRVLHIVGSEKDADQTVTIDLPMSEPNLIAISANNRVLAVGSRDSLDVVVVDTTEKKLVQTLEVPLNQ